MKNRFDTAPDRRGTRSCKWLEQPEGFLPAGAIPMFVAEMDFPVAPHLQEVLEKRVRWPFFGYDFPPVGLQEAIVSHYRERFGVTVEPEWIVELPGMMPGVNLACRMAGGAILFNTPMYSHIRTLGEETGLPVIEVPLARDAQYRFSMDVTAMERRVTPETRAFVLCNPHNPVGRAYTRPELEEIADFCARHDLLLVSDEIHCEFVFEGRHIPCFAAGEAAAQRSITITSPGKIMNVPGLSCAAAIIPNRALRERFTAYTAGMFPFPNVFAREAMKVSYDGSCEDWKTELRACLRSNRDYLEARLAAMPGLTAVHNEATYLTWIDCSALGVESPFQYFLDECGVYLTDGAEFGDKNCVRLNFACPRAQLAEALDRMETAMRKRLR